MALSMMQSAYLSRPSVRCHAKKQKVNDRGKVSSRPGPISPKELKKRAEEAKKQARAEESAATSSATASAEQAPASPTATSTPVSTASSSQPTSSPQPPQPSPPPAPQPQTRPQASSSIPSTTPQVVVDRIFARMVACAGIPVVLGIGLLVVITVLKRQGGDDFPMWPAYLSQGATLMGGLLGISYGALSASWDPAREGSLTGWTEFRANLPIFLSRGKTDNN